ncbi:hypothetical protein HO133_007027 [Letharia lupina]|uniref:Uncharacterized protein n=1 Tax=Letharia lupina TaxID=560253 RepID=A0A8H6CS67_9LECA|nr:uncharacterized protein HO133_007027 [Letharia lupina]KAF6228915.1 hypothetical protein HO133_007027 [Letharia lupina]
MYWTKCVIRTTRQYRRVARYSGNDHLSFDSHLFYERLAIIKQYFLRRTMDEAQKVKNAKGARYKIKKMYYHPYALRTYAVRLRALLKHS